MARDRTMLSWVFQRHWTVTAKFSCKTQSVWHYIPIFCSHCSTRNSFIIFYLGPYRKRINSNLRYLLWVPWLLLIVIWARLQDDQTKPSQLLGTKNVSSTGLCENTLLVASINTWPRKHDRSLLVILTQEKNCQKPSIHLAFTEQYFIFQILYR